MEGIKLILESQLLNFGLSENIVTVILSIFSILLLIIIGIVLKLIINQIIKGVMKKSINSARSETVVKLSNNIARYILWFVIGVLILGELNVDLAPVLATAGVFGLAIGFGAQEIVKDFISGFFILFEGEFNIGEVVEIEGFKGVVIMLGLRTTRIRNWKGEVKIVNNGDIRSVINFSKNDSLAIVDFGVAYETNLNKLNELMEDFVKETFDKYEFIVEEPKFLGVTELANSSINLRLIAKTKTNEHFGIERALRKDIVIFFAKHGISIPFPHIVVKNG